MPTPTSRMRMMGVATESSISETALAPSAAIAPARNA